MNRRRLLALGLTLAAAATAARAHTPYRQWTVYRKRHLMVLGHRADPEGYELVRAVAEALDSPAAYGSVRHRLVLDEGVQGGWG